MKLAAGTLALSPTDLANYLSCAHLTTLDLQVALGQLEAVLAWALKNDLPRGSLAERIEAEGGLGPILEGSAKAA